VPEVEVAEYPSPPSPEELARRLGELDGLVVVGAWSPGDWLRIRGELRRIGARWNRVVYIDAERDPAISGVSLDGLVRSHKAYLEASAEYIPVVVSEAGKTVSRREILKAGLGVFFTYTAMPEVRDAQCSSLKSCSLCLSSCPYGALNGKPPRVSEQKCLECGLCTSSCPSGLLLVPAVPPAALRRLLYELKSSGAQDVVVTCPEGRTSVYSGGLRGAVVELPCVAALRIHEYLLARQLALNVVFHCPAELRSKCPRGRAAEEYLAHQREAELITSSKEAKPVSGEKLPTIIAPLASGESSWIPLSRLPLFRVEVDAEACTLCGACEKACPTHALSLRHGEGYTLLFTHSDCIGCGACASVCPEKAVRLVRAANPALLSARSPIAVASSPEAHCKRCGAPIGPQARIARVAEKLRKAGVPEAQVEKLWLCEKCKQESLADELKEFLERA